MDGEPPDLPESRFSFEARDFVHKCLHKIPKARPTYAMLLRHSWLVPLLRPPTEDAAKQGEPSTEASKVESITDNGFPDTADEEVAEWVRGAIERRKSGNMTPSQAPALHAAPLNVVTSPIPERSYNLGNSDPTADV